MRVDVLTLFPEAFAGPLDVSIIGRARRDGLLAVHLHDIRQHATDRHRSVDDYPFGGRQGMVMRVDVLDRALGHVRALADSPGLVVYLSPQGRRLDDGLVRELATADRLILVCGRYEGVDQRFVDNLVDEEISIGDYILTGGELPAMVLVDAVARHIPGALGDEASSEEESFAGGLLEHPQYTRPAAYRGWPVPAVLVGGNHAGIERWKAEQRIERTRRRRPELLTSHNALLPPAKRRAALRGVSTRIGGPADWEIALQLFADCAPSDHRLLSGEAGAWRQRIEAGALVLYLAEHRGRTVGAALAGFDGLAGRLHAVATDPSQRRRGVGAALVRAVEEALRERGASSLRADLPWDAFEGMALLERCGWAGGGAQVMARQL